MQLVNNDTPMPAPPSTSSPHHHEPLYLATLRQNSENSAAIMGLYGLDDGEVDIPGTDYWRAEIRFPASRFSSAARRNEMPEARETRDMKASVFGAPRAPSVNTKPRQAKHKESEPFLRPKKARGKARSSRTRHVRNGIESVPMEWLVGQNEIPQTPPQTTSPFQRSRPAPQKKKATFLEPKKGSKRKLAPVDSHSKLQQPLRKRVFVKCQQIR